MKLILKKYSSPLIGGSVLFLLLLLFKYINKININYTDIGLYFSTLISVLLIRTIDDILDYNSDIKINKKVIPLNHTLILLIAFLIIMVIMNTYLYGIFGYFAFLIYIGYLFVTFNKKSKISKIFICLVILIINLILICITTNSLINYSFSILYVAVIAFLIIIGSSIYGLVKKG